MLLHIVTPLKAGLDGLVSAVSAVHPGQMRSCHLSGLSHGVRQTLLQQASWLHPRLARCLAVGAIWHCQRSS